MKDYLCGPVDQPYSEDVKLFESLGLKFPVVHHSQEVEIGTVTLYESAKVTIWVDQIGAVFWRFKIVDIDKRTHHISTGSGSLSRFWPTIKLIANGAMTINCSQEARRFACLPKGI